jgi:hypothetical protein
MPRRKGSRCLTRQGQVASYSRALVMTAATATILRAAVLLRRNVISKKQGYFAKYECLWGVRRRFIELLCGMDKTLY